MKAQVPWLRVFVEGVVIVGSILLAFGIEAWWDGVQERRSEQVLLQSLTTEFEYNKEQLAAQLGVYRKRTSAAVALHELGPDAARLAPDSLNALWQWIIRGGTYDPSKGVLEAATTSGDISLIRDLGLRAMLAQWPSDMLDLSEVENRVGNLIFDQFVPWLRTQTALPPSAFGETGWPEGRSATDLDLLLSSVTLENFLREIVAWGRILDVSMSSLEYTLDEIVVGTQLQLEAR